MNEKLLFKTAVVKLVPVFAGVALFTASILIGTYLKIGQNTEYIVVFIQTLSAIVAAIGGSAFSAYFLRPVEKVANDDSISKAKIAVLMPILGSVYSVSERIQGYINRLNTNKEPEVQKIPPYTSFLSDRMLDISQIFRNVFVTLSADEGENLRKQFEEISKVSVDVIMNMGKDLSANSNLLLLSQLKNTENVEKEAKSVNKKPSPKTTKSKE